MRNILVYECPSLVIKLRLTQVACLWSYASHISTRAFSIAAWGDSSSRRNPPVIIKQGLVSTGDCAIRVVELKSPIANTIKINIILQHRWFATASARLHTCKPQPRHRYQCRLHYCRLEDRRSSSHRLWSVPKPYRPVHGRTFHNLRILGLPRQY